MRLRAVRDPGVRRLGGARPRARLVRLAGSSRGTRRELVRLVGQGAPPRVELEQHRLAGLAGEPQLATVGVDPFALAGDGDTRSNVAQPARLDEPDSLDQPHGVIRAVDERGQRACLGDGRRAADATRRRR